MADHYLRIGVVAERLGVTPQTLRRWAKSGRLLPAYIGPGRIRYYKVADVEALVDQPEKPLQPEEGRGLMEIRTVHGHNFPGAHLVEELTRQEALAREVRLVWEGEERPFWGREAWAWPEDSLPSEKELTAWTEDSKGRVVRYWRCGDSVDPAITAYNTPGRLNCPTEAAWMASVAFGRPSLPALPFLEAMNRGYASALGA